MAVLAIFRIRRDTAANWTAVNPVLALGEPGLETDTRRVKYGDGVTAWAGLAYSASGAVAWADITGKPTFGTLSSQNADAVAITGGSVNGISSFGAALGSNNFAVATTGQHLRMTNGAELGVISLLSNGAVQIWAHGDGANDVVQFLTGSGSGSIRGTFASTGFQVVGSLKTSSYTVATLPSAVSHGVGAQVFVSNESGGAVTAFSDGTNWRRSTDRAIVS